MKGLLFTYLLTYGGAAVSLFNPFVGLLIYFCFAIIRPPSMWHWAVPPGNYSRIIAIALLAGWALQGFGNWNFGRAKPIVYALLGYYAWACLSAIFAPNQTLAIGYLEAQGKIVLPFVVGITLIDSLKKLKQVAWVLMLSQAYVALELNRSFYSGYNRVVVEGFGGMDNNCVSIAMVCGAGLAFFLGLGENIWWRKWLSFGCAGLMAHVPMFAMSRGGMLGLCVVGLVSFILIPKKPKHYFAFALAVVLAARLAGPEVVDRFATVFTDAEERDASAGSRLEFWGYCWTFMQENPLLGVGPDHYRSAANQRFGRGNEAHSLWFQTGAELGFPGGGLLLFFYGSTIWLLWPITRRPEYADTPFPENARMVIAALVGFGVSVSFVSIEALELPYYVALVGAGTLKLASDPASENTPEVHESTKSSTTLEKPERQT